MTRKLTLSLDSNIVEFAHNFSQKNNKSISKIIEDYFIVLRERSAHTPYMADLPKDLEDLYGIFEGIDTPDKKELRRMFHEKHSN